MQYSSWVGRFTTHEKYSGGCMKDLDLKRYVIMNGQSRETVVRQLEVDTLFLQRNGIMNYSLLLGICYMTKTQIVFGFKRNNNTPHFFLFRFILCRSRYLLLWDFCCVTELHMEEEIG